MTVDTETRMKRANPITTDEQLDQLFGVDTLDRFLQEVVAKKEGRMTDTKPEQQPTPEKVDAQLSEAQPAKRLPRFIIVLAAFIAVIAVGAVIMFTGDTESPVASNAPVEADTVTVYPKGPTVGDLPGTRWTVYAFVVDGQIVRKLADTEIILQFSHDGVITGTGGCNDYQATYQQTGDYVTGEQGFATVGQFIEFRGLTSTDNVCGSAGLMEQEALYFETLQQTGRWWVVQDRELALGFTQGSAQILGARPAPNE
jgi:heat shock protein HslJ